MIRFGMIGGGWRAEFFLRIARELPEEFQVSGVLLRNEEKAAALEARWTTQTHRDLDGLAKGKPDFVVVCVPRATTPALILELAGRNMPVLAETPPAAEAADLDALNGAVKPGTKIQIAEQYPFQPHLASCIQIARSGMLGEISQAQVSVAHDYHGIAVIRKLLGVGCLPAEIRAQRFDSKIVAGPGRKGPPTSEMLQKSSHTLATFLFGDKVGIYDFTGDQYFSWVRSARLLVRGDRGEIQNETVRTLKDFRTPVTQLFMRENAGEQGNLEGFHLKGITLGDRWIYRNPFPSRLSDDELAVATCLKGMGDYLGGGPGFYGLAEASYDHYLGLMMARSLATGEAVKAGVPRWAA